MDEQLKELLEERGLTEDGDVVRLIEYTQGHPPDEQGWAIHLLQGGSTRLELWMELDGSVLRFPPSVTKRSKFLADFPTPALRSGFSIGQVDLN